MAAVSLGTYVAIGAAVAATGVGVYEATKPLPKPPQLPEGPKLPDSTALLGMQQQADQQARTAGGTILSDKNKQPVQDGANVTRKSLLGQ